MPIRVLEPQVVSRIAAGEVVERPASVVKELVENSLDASARQISVEVRDGGIGLIRVTDNGLGIPATELELAFERYATSKLASASDLESIGSLGFRGEALPSIAAVSQIEIISCAAGAVTGSSLNLDQGTVVSRGSRGHSPGTTITVSNLLRNVPARLKFLKSPTTENSHIAHAVSQYALAYPEVKFTLSTDGRTVLRTSGSGRLIDSIIEIYGPEIAGNMLEVGQDQKGWEDSPASPLVTGMVGTPSVNRASRTYLSFFVNRRWISSRLLSWAVEEAYHGLLMTGKHPVAVINIALPPEEVDVNVHPTKTEIRFRDERFIFSAVQKKIRQALIELSPSPRIEEVATAYQTRAGSRQLFRTPDASPRTPVSNLPLTAATTPAFSLPALRLLGQLAGSYIVAEGPDGLYLIDQHAAHERVLFEKIRQQMSQQKIEVQGLLEPETLEVTPGQDATLKSGYLSLVESGFTLEPFGERTYLVRRIPALLHRKDWAGMLSELLDTPADNHDWTEKIAMTMACHSAVRAGQTLSDDEMRALLRQLEQAALPNTCPHGRPTMIHLDSGQLEREFGRS